MNRGIYIGVLLLIGFLGSFQVLPNNLLALTVFVIVFLKFYQALNTHIPILEITACIATLQWLIGPVIGYYFGSSNLRYEMYIEATRYFSFALPGTCVYLAALDVWPAEKHQFEYLKDLRERIFFNRGVTLFAISLVAQVAAGYAPGSLAFLFFLISQLRYIGAIYFLFSGHPLRYLMILVSIGTLLIRSAESAMFHDLIIWVSLIACYWFQTIRWNPPKKAAFFVAGFICVFVIQITKADYRAKVWGGEDASLVTIIYEKIVKDQEFYNEKALKAAGQRINQGWIISAIMLHVPLVEPYAGGETVKNAVVSSIFPRAIMANKSQAGGQENFERFTGLQLESGTSMGISILGEGYANYGRFGGVIFMAFWGVCYAAFYRFATNFAKKNPTFLFWIPLIFYQAIKAETELLVVLNQLIKGSIVVFAGYIGLNMLIPEKKDEEEQEDEFDDGNSDDEEPEIGRSQLSVK